MHFFLLFPVRPMVRMKVFRAMKRNKNVQCGTTVKPYGVQGLHTFYHLELVGVQSRDVWPCIAEHILEQHFEQASKPLGFVKSLSAAHRRQP